MLCYNEIAPKRGGMNTFAALSSIIVHIEMDCNISLVFPSALRAVLGYLSGWAVGEFHLVSAGC